MNDCTCPYCNRSMDDPEEAFEQEITYEHECPYCEKIFIFTVDYIRIYSENRADCLNGAPHQYEPTCTYPREYSQMRCKTCANLRPCTKKEMARIMRDNW